MKFETFEDILAWQKSINLCIEIYSQFGKISDRDFKSQILRASVSISNNIAEGFERLSDAEFKRFLFIAKGSVGEVRSMLYLAKHLKFISTENFEKLFPKCVEISKMLSGLVKSLNSN